MHCETLFQMIMNAPLYQSGMKRYKYAILQFAKSRNVRDQIQNQNQNQCQLLQFFFGFVYGNDMPL